VGCRPARNTDAVDDSGLAPVALDADLVPARARQRAARMVEPECPLDRRKALPELDAALAHDRKARCKLRDPDDLLTEDGPGRHAYAAKSANFA
jgi:hypothetical protein